MYTEHDFYQIKSLLLGLTPSTMRGSAENAVLILHRESPKADAAGAGKAVRDDVCVAWSPLSLPCRRPRQFWKATPRKVFITISVIGQLQH